MSEIAPGTISEPERRKAQVKKEIESNIRTQSDFEPRFRRVPAKIWEGKDSQIRTFLKSQYSGKCQICSYTFPKADGQPYHEGIYLVSRTIASWVERPGNVLCLCANCAAKFLHGAVEARNIDETIKNIKIDPTTEIAEVKVKLCSEDVSIKFSPRHLIDLQELLRADADNIV